MVDALLGYCVHVEKYISLDFLFSYTCNFASLLLQITNPRWQSPQNYFFFIIVPNWKVNESGFFSEIPEPLMKKETW